MARLYARPINPRMAIRSKTLLGDVREAPRKTETKGATSKRFCVGTTGYAKDILKDVLNADVALVETVAHTESALKVLLIIRT